MLGHLNRGPGYRDIRAREAAREGAQALERPQGANKQNAWKRRIEAGCRKAEELREKGLSGTSKHAITRHEHREARKKAAATNSAEAEATIAADFDAAIADEAIDKSAVDAMALVQAENSTKEAEKEAEARKKNKLTDAKRLLLLREQLLEHERANKSLIHCKHPFIFVSMQVFHAKFRPVRL
jgi:hypothetical protein